MSAAPMEYAHAVRRARLLGSMEPASIGRRGQSVDARYGAVFGAIAGSTIFDRHQERNLFRCFAEEYATACAILLAAGGMPDDEVTEVDPPPVRRRGVKRFLYALRGRA